MEVFRIGDRPVEHHGRGETFRTGETADFVVNLIKIRSQSFAVGVLIGTIGELTFGMEGKLEPLFVCLKLLFVVRRHIRKGEVLVVIVGVKEVQQELGVVFVMDLFETPKKHGVKDGVRSLLCDVTQKETAVVKEKVAALERFFIPQYSDGKGTLPEIV